LDGGLTKPGKVGDFYMFQALIGELVVWHLNVNKSLHDEAFYTWYTLALNVFLYRPVSICKQWSLVRNLAMSCLFLKFFSFIKYSSKTISCFILLYKSNISPTFTHLLCLWCFSFICLHAFVL
jgi:hypothetical protein